MVLNFKILSLCSILLRTLDGCDKEEKQLTIQIVF